jgi:sulfite reductase (NADPH) flavoprotein alpha-component
LLLISIGFALTLNRQRSLRSLSSTVKEKISLNITILFLGRLMLIPILDIALSGTYLTLKV